MKCKSSSKKIISVIMLLLASLSFCQSITPTKADKLFDDFKFNLAIKEYLNLTKSKRPDSTYIQTRLADCYYQLYNYEQAIVWYSKALKNDSDPELNFRYAQMLKAAGDYAKASEQMTLFSKMRPEDQRAINFMKNPNYLNEVIERSARYTLSAMTLNTNLDEFGGVLVGNTFFFVSNRERKNAQKENSDQTGKNFTNVYTSNFANGEVTNINEFRELNTRWNDELLTFNKNKEVLYMSSENYSLNLSKDPKFKNMTDFSDGVFAIFKSTFEKNSFWSNFEPLSFTEKEYSYSDPFLTADSKTLYFSSNMPGGFGGMDVWKVTILDDGSYSAPINLGNEINTPTDERFPFLDEQKNEFYFSSNGHLGLGGLDIFKVQLNGGIKKPINLLQPVNSSGNDFAFIYYHDRNLGFISSDREGNKNIYQIKEIPLVKIDFKIMEETNSLPIKNAKILIKDVSNNKIIDIVYSNENGQAIGMVQKNKEISIEVETKNHLKETLKLSPSALEKNANTVSLKLKPINIQEETMLMELEVLFDLDKYNINYDASITLNKVVELLNQNTAYKLLATTHTDSRGSEEYNFNLSNLRARAVEEYLISKKINPDRIHVEGVGSSMPKVNCLDQCSEEDHRKNRRTSFTFTKG